MNLKLLPATPESYEGQGEVDDSAKNFVSEVTLVLRLAARCSLNRCRHIAHRVHAALPGRRLLASACQGSASPLMVGRCLCGRRQVGMGERGIPAANCMNGGVRCRM